MHSTLPRTTRLARTAATAAAFLAAVPWIALAAPQAATPDSGFVDIIISFTASDGTPLVGKLSVPAGATQPVPVAFHLHGAGPRTYDNALQYRDAGGQVRVTRYYDYYARELARKGLAFFRISKRGCTSDSTGRPHVDRAVFSTATPTVLLDDYERALAVLRQRPEIDPARIVLSGSSEGTRLAPQLALRSPSGVVGLMLMSHQSDNQRNTVVWQNTVGPWRNVQALIPAAGDGALTRDEHDAAVRATPGVAQRLPFAQIDTDSNGVATPAELMALVRPRLDAILHAVETRNDDVIWQVVANLSSAYLLDGWDAEPTQVFLLKLDIPVGIFHGELDGTTRVEGVRETEAAFRAAGKSNLTVHLYPTLDHDLGWTVPAASGRGPLPYQDAFRFAAQAARR